MDWKALFKGFEATVDFPACVYYRELLREFPNAKVVLTVRDQERWYQSFLTLQETTDCFRVSTERRIPGVWRRRSAGRLGGRRGLGRCQALEAFRPKSKPAKRARRVR
jgi:hypothetical protein